MNLKDAYRAAVRLQTKLDTHRALAETSQNPNARSASNVWGPQFVEFFEAMDFEERKFLREIGRYQTLLETYDIAKESGDASAFVINSASQVFAAVRAYVQTNASFNKDVVGLSSENSVEITFPIVSRESTTFDFVDEVDWFFKVFNKVSEELSEEPFRPVVRTVDNIDLSISVLIDWKFLLAAMLLWNFIQKRSAESSSIQAALKILIGSGLAPDEAEELEKKLSKTEKAIIDEARQSFEEVAGKNEVSGWQASFNGLAKHLMKARDRGYHLEFMAERDAQGKIAAGSDAFIEIVRDLSYSRENDRGGAGKAELLDKPKTP